ncbi:MAG TPA: LptA/OstA family protein, partial [Opitutaceae bacterium]|nr:LptA/OstA family protein [Opitutaceae bacterium]
LVIDSNDSGTVCVWQGHVVLTGTGIEVQSDYLRGETAGKGDPLTGTGSYSSYKHMLATGHVRIVRGEYVATCGQAEMFPQEDRIVLTDHPVVTSPRGEQSGTTITLSKDAQGNRHVAVDGAGDAKTRTEIRGLKGINLAAPKPAAEDGGAAKTAPPPIAK